MGENNTRRKSRVDYDSAAWLVTGIGVILGAGGLAYLFTHPEPPMVWTIELLLIGIPAVAIAYGGYWISAQEISRSDRRSIAAWCLTGAVVAGVLFGAYLWAEQAAGERIVNAAFIVVLGGLGGASLSLLAAIATERRHLEVPTGRREPVEADVGSLSDDARTLATLALDARSWYVVRAVTLADEPVGVESIAARIAAAEGIDSIEAYADLVHVRIPKLADHDLVRYDADRDVVSPTESVVSMADAGSELAAAGETLVSEDESIHS